MLDPQGVILEGRGIILEPRGVMLYSRGAMLDRRVFFSFAISLHQVSLFPEAQLEGPRLVAPPQEECSIFDHKSRSRKLLRCPSALRMLISVENTLNFLHRYLNRFLGSRMPYAAFVDR